MHFRGRNLTVVPLASPVFHLRPFRGIHAPICPCEWDLDVLMTQRAGAWWVLHSGVWFMLVPSWNESMGQCMRTERASVGLQLHQWTEDWMISTAVHEESAWLLSIISVAVPAQNNNTTLDTDAPSSFYTTIIHWPTLSPPRKKGGARPGTGPKKKRRKPAEAIQARKSVAAANHTCSGCYLE